MPCQRAPVLLSNSLTKPAEKVLELNIGHVPLTEEQLKQLFDAMDTDSAGKVTLDRLRVFFKSLETYGLDYHDREIEYGLKEFCGTFDGALSFDEFCCFMLRISRW